MLWQIFYEKIFALTPYISKAQQAGPIWMDKQIV